MPPSVGIALLQIIIYPVMSRSSFLSSLDLCWATLDAWLRTSSSRELPERVIGFDSNVPRALVNLFAWPVALPPLNAVRPERPCWPSQYSIYGLPSCSNFWYLLRYRQRMTG